MWLCRYTTKLLRRRIQMSRMNHFSVSQQSSNVLFGQSRNVLLTGSSLEGGRRTTADDPGRARPAGGLEEGQEETDHAEAGCRGDRHHRAAGAATPAEAAAERRPAVIHELRGRESNRKLSSELEQRALTILSDPVYRGLG